MNVRDQFRRYLEGAESRLRSLGYLRTPKTAAVWIKLHGLDRLDALRAGEPVEVYGYEVSAWLGPKDRRRIDGDSRYTLGEDGRLSPVNSAE